MGLRYIKILLNRRPILWTLYMGAHVHKITYCPIIVTALWVMCFRRANSGWGGGHDNRDFFGPPNGSRLSARSHSRAQKSLDCHGPTKQQKTTDNNTQQQYTPALRYIKLPMSRCLKTFGHNFFLRLGLFKGSKKSWPPQNVPRNGSLSYCPTKKSLSRSFLNSVTLIVIMGGGLTGTQ